MQDLNILGHMMPLLIENTVYLNILACILILSFAFTRARPIIEFKNSLEKDRLIKAESAVEKTQNSQEDKSLYYEALNQELLFYTLNIKATKNQRIALEKLLSSGHATLEDAKEAIFHIDLKNGIPTVTLGLFDQFLKWYVFMMFIIAVISGVSLLSWVFESKKVVDQPLLLLLPIIILIGGFQIFKGAFPILAAERIKKNIEKYDN